jgi:hypothetical protein
MGAFRLLRRGEAYLEPPSGLPALLSPLPAALIFVLPPGKFDVFVRDPDALTLAGIGRPNGMVDWAGRRAVRRQDQMGVRASRGIEVWRRQRAVREVGQKMMAWREGSRAALVLVREP